MDIVERLRNEPELTPAQYWESQADMWHQNYKEAAAEIERLREYERLVKFIANDYVELSYEKVQWQRDDWKKRCIAIQQKESK